MTYLYACTGMPSPSMWAERIRMCTEPWSVFRPFAFEYCSTLFWPFVLKFSWHHNYIKLSLSQTKASPCMCKQYTNGQATLKYMPASHTELHVCQSFLCPDLVQTWPMRWFHVCADFVFSASCEGATWTIWTMVALVRQLSQASPNGGTNTGSMPGNQASDLKVRAKPNAKSRLGCNLCLKYLFWCWI